MTLRSCPKPDPTQPKPRRPVPKSNPARKAKRYEAAYGLKGQWIRGLPCCCSGRRTGDLIRQGAVRGVMVVVVAAHFPSRGAGGDSQNLVPLADHLHRWAHDHGERALEKRFGVNFREFAAQYEARWQALQRRAAR